MRCNTSAWPALLFFALPALAQLVPAGQPIPRTAKPPVVFVNGYQNDCGGSSFEGTFGIADQVLQANGEVSVFFDNCMVPGKPSIEKLAAGLGSFLSGLRYTDGTPVTTVDIVAHSMGGLIVRSYMSGKQDQVPAFAPPGTTEIRKLVFLATPHFGTQVANLGLGLEVQLDELSSGSHFLWDLNTWNDNTDDLRGVDAIAVIGNAGTGRAIGLGAGFDDGVVSLTSASLGFYLPGRTRILPVCHVEPSGLVGIFGLCPSDAKGVARIRAGSDDSARIVTSFLNGTDGWKTIGQAPEQNAFLSKDAGLYARPFTNTGDPVTLNSATATGQGTSSKLNQSNNQIGYLDLFSAGEVSLAADTSAGAMTRAATLQPGTDQAITIKPGPIVNRVQSAAAALFPYSFAPRSIVSIYGLSLATGTAQAATIPLPTTLSDAQVLIGNTAIPLFYASPLQINAALPDGLSGLVKLTVRNGAGSHTVNLLIEPVRPAIFTADSSGQGLAAAIRWNNNAAVGPSNPLRAGDFVELFVSGLGTLSAAGTANPIPTVTIAGANCPVTYAGAAPGFTGLDQINCQIPAGLGANPAAVVTVTSGGQTSNAATLVLE